MKPVIGITTSYSEDTNLQTLNLAYCKAVEKNGGIPLLITYIDNENIPQLLSTLDGILLAGGEDIDPYLYGDDPHVSGGNISPLRDSFEFDLCRQALDVDIPLLGICRGAQLMCAADGGSLIQDITAVTTSTFKHKQEAPKWYGTHFVNIEKDTLMFKIVNIANIRVNSYHHQCVNIPGKRFIVSGSSSDNIVEAVESTKNTFAIGVQWHPEFMYEKNESHNNLFKFFVNAANEYKGRKI